MQFRKALRVAKEVLIDPGFGFAMSGVFMFALINPMALWSCAVATVMAGGILAARIVKPAFLEKDNVLSRWIKDDGATLRLMGLAMCAVAGATLVMNGIDLGILVSSPAEFIQRGWSTTIMPTVAAAAYAVTNFRFAADVAANQRRERGENIPFPKADTLGGKIKLAGTRAETYFAIGSVCSGLMAGGLSLISFPLVLSGYLIGMRNVIRKNPPHVGHSNMHFAGMSAVLSTVAVIAAQPLLAMSYLCDMIYLGRVEALVTPGGIKQVWADFREGVAAVTGKISGRGSSVRKEVVPDFVPSASSSLPETEILKRDFAQARQPAPSESVPPVPHKPMEPA